MDIKQIEKSGWSQEQVLAWSRGNWTPVKLMVLEVRADDHIDNCDECQERLEVDPSTLPDDEPYYCPIGEFLSEEASQASVEYSWQPDFDPDAMEALRRMEMQKWNLKI